eukprot:scaffold79_cov145-Amphora_coffeaeformis.AAC.3
MGDSQGALLSTSIAWMRRTKRQDTRLLVDVDRVQTNGKKGNETRMKQWTANKQRTTPCDEVETPRMMGNAVCQVPSQIVIDK